MVKASSFITRGHEGFRVLRFISYKGLGFTISGSFSQGISCRLGCYEV